jgi:hypothetical protein
MTAFLKYNEKLTKYIKEEFGEDFIDKAFFMCDFEGCKSHVVERLIEITELFESSKDNNLDGRSIVILFKNGRYIVIWNSEWGGVEREVGEIVILEDGHL